MTPKTETPTVEKKVLEKNDSSGGEGIWQDAADYDAGDTVSFRISAVLPGNIRSYEKYTVRLHDNLSSAFTYSNDAVIYSVNNGEKKNVTDVFSIQKDGTNLTFSCDNILLCCPMLRYRGIQAIRIPFTWSIHGILTEMKQGRHLRTK